MLRIALLLLGLLSACSNAQAQNLSPQAQAMLESIRVTNTVIINCTYEPECMLKSYGEQAQQQENDFVKNVMRLNIDNLNSNKDSFAEFNTNCNTAENTSFDEMNKAEIICLKQINLDITENKGIAKMRADKLSCMQAGMNPLVANGNLFAAQKMVNLLGQYGMLDAQDEMRARLQENQPKDAEQKFSACQAIYDNLKPKFR